MTVRGKEEGIHAEGGNQIGRGKRRPTQTKHGIGASAVKHVLVTSTTLNGTTPTRVSRTMSDTGSDYTEQTGMVSELTLEREVRRERPAAQAAAADPAAAAAAAPTPPRAAGVTHEYRGGVEESKEIPEEEVEEEEEEDLVGDEDDEIESSISQRQQGRTSHKSTVDALASPDEQSTTTASSGDTGTGKSSVQREKIRAAALKARRASSRAVQSAVKYERDHQLVQTTWAGIRQGVRYAGRKVRECTSVDTTATPSGDGGK